jgi:methylmalonyl-CoA mutase cobalamin-binding subunit
MKAGMAVLKPLLSAKDGTTRVGTLLMGTVRGDLHDIGKNLVCMMARARGLKSSTSASIRASKSSWPRRTSAIRTIIGMSALLTTTMTYMKTVIDGFAAAGRNEIRFAVGGAPISQMFADEIGADGYGQNASAAVDLFLRSARGESAPAAAPVAVASRPTTATATAKDGKVTTYKVLYWQEIPSQIRAEDDAGNEVSLELPKKFAEHIDCVAAKRGFPTATRTRRSGSGAMNRSARSASRSRSASPRSSKRARSFDLFRDARHAHDQRPRTERLARAVDLRLRRGALACRCRPPAARTASARSASSR